MADAKISALTAATAVLGADEFVINQAGTSKKVTLSQIRDVVNAKQDHAAIGDDSNDDTAELVAATAAAVAAGLPLYIPAGTYKITTALDWRTAGLRVIGAGRGRTIIKQYTTNTQIILVGDEQQYIADMSLRYSAQAATTDTNSVAILVYKAYASKFERLETYWAYKGIGLYQGDVTTAGGGSTNNWMFSCGWDDIEIRGYRYRGLDLKGYNAASTGCVFRNIYVRNGPTGSAETADSFPVYIRDVDDGVFLQLNVESVNLSAVAAAVFAEGGNVTINSLHLEGISQTTWEGCLVHAYNTASLTINGMTIQGCTFGNDGSYKSHFKLGSTAYIQVRGLKWGNANTNSTGADVLYLGDSQDQTGFLTVDGVATSAWETAMHSDTGWPPVLRSLNGVPAGLPRVKKLTSQHSISSATGTKVTGLDMTLEVGTYTFDYSIIERSGTITVAPLFAFNFSGTATVARWWFEYADLSATLLAAIGTTSHNVSTPTLGFGMRQSEDTMATSTSNMGPSATTNAVQTTATDILVKITGLLVVSVAGDMQLYHSSETANATSVEVGSSLVVHRTA